MDPLTKAIREQCQKADVELNEIYSRLKGALPTQNTDYKGPSKPELIRMQRAWIVRRDASCGRSSLTNANETILGCVIDLTKARTEELDALYDAARDPCVGGNGGALEVGECAHKRLDQAKVKHDRTYEELLAFLPESRIGAGLTKSKLRDDEQTWTRWMESYCDNVGRRDGGAQMWQSSYTVACWADATQDRARKLQRLLKDHRSGPAEKQK